MNLSFDSLTAHGYSNPTQIARVLTEAWVKTNLCCPSCWAPTLLPAPPNSKSIDFSCSSCKERYQLKSGKTLPKKRIVDSAYGSMIDAIRSDKAPNLLYLHYRLGVGVQNLFFVPRFFFTENCIEKRKPLAPTARRAGWVGCNIRIDFVPDHGRIFLIRGGLEVRRDVVMVEFARVAVLRDMRPSKRSWTITLLNELERFRSEPTFSLAQAYEFEPVLSQVFPHNRHVRHKIRQQLQVLRDLGLIEFLGDGNYRFRPQT